LKIIAYITAIVLAGPFFFAATGLALVADEVLVVANRNAGGSMATARYYMAQRGVPDQNLVRIFVTDAETCTREDYDRQIARPIREKLETYPLARRPRCIVLVAGVPLRIDAAPLSEALKAQLDGWMEESRQSTERLKEAADPAEEKSIRYLLAGIEKKIEAFNMQRNTGAAVDSELMLVLADNYALPMWVANPFFLGFKDQTTQVSRNDVSMVSRLDGPTPQIVQRMIDDAMAAEKSGLAGTACFDARYADPGDKALSGYARYDQSIRLAAQRLRKKELMPVVLEETEELFQAGDCPRAALYCGWYSLARYVDAFEWVPGAVGYHIASAECRTLRAGDSQVWCKRMLEAGAAVTIGPVDEPYVQAFPLPEIFFGLLTEGTLTVAECYLLSLPYLSWKMVLVGDPLYRPFKAG
jgi:uncharacterized protein (TIGR03790 family)